MNLERAIGQVSRAEVGQVTLADARAVCSARFRASRGGGRVNGARVFGASRRRVVVRVSGWQSRAQWAGATAVGNEVARINFPRSWSAGRCDAVARRLSVEVAK